MLHLPLFPTDEREVMTLQKFLENIETAEIAKHKILVYYKEVNKKKIPVYRKYLCYDLGFHKIKKSVVETLKMRALKRETTLVFIENEQLVLYSKKPKFLYRLYLQA